MKSIQSSFAPKPFGPYSQAVSAGDFIFCSGQLGINPADDKLAEGAGAQTEQILKNLQAVLKEGESDFAKVVRCDIFLTDLNDFAKVNEVYSQYFTSETAPARQTVEVSRLPKGAVVEISCIALITNK